MVIPTFQQSNSALTTASLSKLFRDGLLSAVIPAPSINKPRMNMPAFKAMTSMAKRPMTRLMAPQTMPRTAALRMVLRAQTTSRAWFWAESKTGWCDIALVLSKRNAEKASSKRSPFWRDAKVRGGLALRAPHQSLTQHDICSSTPACRSNLNSRPICKCTNSKGTRERAVELQADLSDYNCLKDTLLAAPESGTYLHKNICMKLKFYGTRGSIPICDAGF